MPCTAKMVAKMVVSLGTKQEAMLEQSANVKFA